MRTKTELLREAQRQTASARQRAMTLAARRRQAAAAAIPELEPLEDKVRSLGIRLVQLAAAGAKEEEQNAARTERAAAQKQLETLLADHGYGPASLEPAFECPVCKDTGVVNGRMCACVSRRARQLRREEIAKESPLSLCGFDSMELRYYPDEPDEATGVSIRTEMAETLAALRDYAESFDMKSTSLLLCGNAGLGKTHAALAIAQTVLEKGFDVVYISAQSLFGQLERDRFADDCPLMEAALEADLLVLDDLGTEYVSPYVLSCFYNLLNTRLLEKRPTVYTTNIVDGKAFEARYTEKIASRLGGSCEPVLFLGQDIRKLKSME